MPAGLRDSDDGSGGGSDRRGEAQSVESVKAVPDMLGEQDIKRSAHGRAGGQADPDRVDWSVPRLGEQHNPEQGDHQPQGARCCGCAPSPRRAVQQTRWRRRLPNDSGNGRQEQSRHQTGGDPGRVAPERLEATQLAQRGRASARKINDAAESGQAMPAGPTSRLNGSDNAEPIARRTSGHRQRPRWYGELAWVRSDRFHWPQSTVMFRRREIPLWAVDSEPLH